MSDAFGGDRSGASLDTTMLRIDYTLAVVSLWPGHGPFDCQVYVIREADPEAAEQKVLRWVAGKFGDQKIKTVMMHRADGDPALSGLIDLLLAKGKEISV